jgi:hypothetical protein
MMKELITEDTFNRIVSVLAIAGPLAGVIVGFCISRVRRSGVADVLRGVAIGALGVANWAMWRLYEAITAQFGLSSTRNLLIQLGVFIVVGISVGVVYTVFFVKPRQTD